MNIGCVFCNVKELTLDTDNGLPELFAEECPSDVYPLTQITQSLSIRCYTSVSIESSSSLSYLESIPWNTYKYLRMITIGPGCCSYMTSFVIENLPSLQTIDIGNGSFNGACPRGGSFTLSHLPQLKSLSIGSHCFTHFTRVTIHDLEVCLSLHIGSDCFSSQDLVSGQCRISSLPLLTECVFEEYCFFAFDHPILQQLPVLEQLIFKSFTFHRSTTPTLLFYHLPSLKKIEFGPSSFASTSNLSLQDYKVLEEVILRENSFCQTGSLGCCSIKSCPRLKSITIRSGSFMNGHELNLSGMNSEVIMMIELKALTSLTLDGSQPSLTSFSTCKSLTLESKCCCESIP